MEDISNIQLLIDMVQQFGLWVFFAWLYMQERKAHDDTRRERLEDLREIAGLRRPFRADDTQASLSVGRQYKNEAS